MGTYLENSEFGLGKKTSKLAATDNYVSDYSA